MSAPQPIQTHLYPYQRAMQRYAFIAGRQFGKTAAMAEAMRRQAAVTRQATVAFAGLRPMLVIHDDIYCRELRALGPIERPDRSHFERGGRHRKPPVSERAITKEPGAVQVRARDGSLVWKKIGKGMAHATAEARMRSHGMWGAF